MKSFKRRFRDWVRTLGYEITPYDGTPLGRDAQADMRYWTQVPRPVVLDVGANRGQSIIEFKRSFPNSRIHSFEPCRSTYEMLKALAVNYTDVVLNHLGVGSKREKRNLVEYSTHTMNSFLAPGADAAAYGQVKSESACEMTTVDAYCEQAGLKQVDILKIDAQGMDLDVMEGAMRMMSEHRIKLVYVEIVFAQIYEGQTSAIDILRFMEERGFRLVSFYRFIYLNDVASWSDALFVDPKFVPEGI
jgi:FkbM family methyltransferase